MYTSSDQSFQWFVVAIVFSRGSNVPTATIQNARFLSKPTEHIV